jgi:phosphatidylglycerol lysyltransferase
VALTVISVIGNITKAIDYEEASLALFTLIALILTRRQYFIRNNPKLTHVGINAALFSIAAVISFGITGFYFLDKMHFNIDFNFWQSAKYTLQNFFLFESGTLHPGDRFARNFLYTINISGAVTLLFLLYATISPYVFKEKTKKYNRMIAHSLLKKYGPFLITKGSGALKTNLDLHGTINT